MSSSSGNYSGSSGHMCTYETCVLRTSLTVDNFGRRFLGCSRYKVSILFTYSSWFTWDWNVMCSIQFMNSLVPSALSLNGLIIPLVYVGMKLPIWCNKSWIYCGVSCNLHMKGKEKLPRQQQKLPKWQKLLKTGQQKPLRGRESFELPLFKPRR